MTLHRRPAARRRLLPLGTSTVTLALLLWLVAAVGWLAAAQEEQQQQQSSEYLQACQDIVTHAQQAAQLRNAGHAAESDEHANVREREVHGCEREFATHLNHPGCRCCL